LRAEVVRDVHHMTYGALIAELLNSGREIPDDLHGVYVGELVKFR
jgi:hypothetical protein